VNLKTSPHDCIAPVFQQNVHRFPPIRAIRAIRG
jgi:hypothetical protein